MEELLEEAFDRKRRREAKRESDAEVGGQCSALGRSPGDMSGQGPALGRSIPASGEGEYSKLADTHRSVGAASSSAESSTSRQLMKAKPKQRAQASDQDEGKVILKPKLHARTIAKRVDVPTINYTRRGDKKKALEVASDPGLLQEALESYDRDVKSTNDTSQYYVKTWTELHEAVKWAELALDEHEPLLPLTAVKIRVVGSALKAGGYRSTKKYLSAIKQVHTERGYKWSELLELSSRRFTAATTRGIGPDRQSEPLCLDKFITVGVD